MTETSISGYDNFLLESAEQYLQTVVLIDDRIYDSKSGGVVSPAVAPKPALRKSALKSVATSADTSSKEKEKDDDSNGPAEATEREEVSFHDVQNSFAKKRIICSLYQPKKSASFSETSEIYKLCSVADVVVVDWDLHGDFGKRATDLVGVLVEQSIQNIPHQLRLILIYTMDTNLGSVASDIFDALGDRLGEDSIIVQDGSEGLILTTDNARVVILGKRPNISLPQYSDFFVLEKNLAERTIREFSALASGLLQGIVLRGLAKIHENNRRVLTRFNKDLDIAFLAHRALLLPEEAFGQIIPLLTDELHAVLDDTLGNSPLGKKLAVKAIVEDWCDKNWKTNSNATLKIGDGINGQDFVKDAFCNGADLENNYVAQNGKIPSLVNNKQNGQPRWNENKCDQLAEYLLGDGQVDRCHEKLGSLMSQRIRYDNAPKSLHLGVIVRELTDKKRYLLCLQPVCDSVRLESKSRTFVFTTMNQAEDGKRLTDCVVDIHGYVVGLDYKPTVLSIFVANFPARGDVVSASKNDAAQFIFKDDNENGYEWIAELKTAHAQRAAEQFGHELSRVGLTESEWLRIRARKT